MNDDRCDKHVSERHVYKYDGNNYICRNCGKTMLYDLMNRDMK